MERTKIALKIIGIGIAGLVMGLLLVNFLLFLGGSALTWPFGKTDFTDDQGILKEQYQQPDIKTVANEWPMKPPVIVPMSDWDPSGHSRWVKAGGYLAIECRTSPGFSSVSFILENAPMATMPARR